MEEKRSVYVTGEKREGNRSQGKPRRSWGNNIRIGFGEIG
jgi:hypothetical protein